MSGPLEWKNLVFEGGGVSGFAAILALTELCENGVDFGKVERCVGTSIGALIALLFVTGALPSVQNTGLLRSLFLKFARRHKVSAWKALFSVLSRHGAVSSRVLEDLVTACFELRSESLSTLSPDVTFAELYQTTGKVLVVTLHNVHTMENLYVHHLNYPNASVLHCVATSMNVPGAFEPVRTLTLGGSEPHGSWYVDGALLDNYPLAIFSNANWEHVLPANVDWRVQIKDTLGFKMLEKNERYARDVYEPEVVSPLGLFTYAARFIYSALSFRYEGVQWSKSAEESTLQLPAVGVLELSVLEDEVQWENFKQRVQHSVLHFLAQKRK